MGYVNPFWFIPHISTQFSFFWRKLSCQQCGNFYLFVTEVFVLLVKANNTSTLYLLVKWYFPSSRNWASVWWVWWVEAVKISSLLYLFFTKSVMFSLCPKHSPIISVSAFSSPYFFCYVSYQYMVTKWTRWGCHYVGLVFLVWVHWHYKPLSVWSQISQDIHFLLRFVIYSTKCSNFFRWLPCLKYHELFVKCESWIIIV